MLSTITSIRLSLALAPLSWLFVFSVTAQVFNRIDVITEENSVPLFSGTEVINDRIFFTRRDGVLQVSDGSDVGTLDLVDQVALGNTTNDIMVEFNDELYFYRQLGDADDLGGFELWRTDGTITNTHQVLALELPLFFRDLALHATADRLFLAVRASTLPDDIGTRLAISDGIQTGTEVLAIENPDLNTLCVINADNFYVFASNDDGTSDRRSIVHFRNGQVQTVQLNNPQLEFSHGSGNAIGSKCLYEVSEIATDLSQALSVDANGNQQLHLLPTRLPDASDRQITRIRFQDKLLLFRSVSINTPATVDTQIFAFDPDVSELIPTSLSLQGTTLDGLVLSSLQASAELIYALAIPDPAGPQASPTPPALMVRFDSNFDLVGEPLSTLIGGFNQTPGSIINLQGTDYFMGSNSGTVSKIIDSRFVTVIRHYDMSLQRVVSRRGVVNQAVYAFATDRQTNQIALYRFSGLPNISERLVGIWNNEAFNRTGVQINTAIGQDGRRFLFLALLAHADDEPVWMAGAIPIVDGNVSATIDLNLSSGLPFLVPDPGLDAERTAVGQATIKMVGCDELNISFDLIEPFGFHQHNFKRLVDTTTAPLCSDVDASL